VNEQQPSNILVFDLETKRLAEEVGGWSNIGQMGFAAGVLLDVKANRFLHFTEENVLDLIEQIHHADIVVGFNLNRFDYEVLRPYGLSPARSLTAKSIDLLEHIYQALGFRLSLDNLAATSLGAKKSADGLAAVRWYREGEIQKVLDYCQQDVRVTYELWQYGIQNGYVRYQDRRRVTQRVPIDWSLPQLTPGTS
jgi:DEAD/DEAH box helicase domain-containing protein